MDSKGPYSELKLDRKLEKSREGIRRHKSIPGGLNSLGLFVHQCRHPKGEGETLVAHVDLVQEGELDIVLAYSFCLLEEICDAADFLLNFFLELFIDLQEFFLFVVNFQFRHLFPR